MTERKPLGPFSSWNPLLRVVSRINYIKSHVSISIESQMLCTACCRYYQIPEFTLDDFALKVSEEEKLPLLQVQHIMFSKHSYRAIQKMLADICLSKQTTIHKINFSVAGSSMHLYCSRVMCVIIMSSFHLLCSV